MDNTNPELPLIAVVEEKEDNIKSKWQAFDLAKESFTIQDYCDFNQLCLFFKLYYHATNYLNDKYKYMEYINPMFLFKMGELTTNQIIDQVFIPQKAIFSLWMPV